MGTWNTAYEALPRNKNNPGYGATAIRELKKEISGRMDNEHYFGNDDETAFPLLTGNHKEGSARVTVVDPFVNPDRGNQVTDVSVGRVLMDLDDISVARTYDGDGVATAPAGKFDVTNTSVDAKNQIIKVQAYDENDESSLVVKEIFNADRFVDIKFDQDIDGKKNFELSPKLANPDTVVGANLQTTDLFQAYLDGGLTAEQKKQAVPLGMFMDHLYRIVDELLISNSGDAGMEAFWVARNEVRVDGKLSRTLALDSINANTVTGATWNA
jgi:hypothetical protein